ncbi:MAG: exodeoxyribonuclease VII large subunit [Bacteroidales bacterium]|jgi:exodeoxyribonuclease VII large subunit|nr:exodeoxyribonuclease VII large subunit [Bacteroidales bacterium]
MIENNQNGAEIMTLSQLAAGITVVFEENFRSPLWIKAEIAKLNYYQASGHCYPSLVEKEKGSVKAELRGTIWANDYVRINGNFLKITREPLKEGIQILFRAYVRFHAVYGLSLQIIDIDPSYTLGEMAREKMETLARLKNEGLFDRNRQIELPELPKRIAVISVKSSKGFSDFISIIENNPWHYGISCVLFPALLQGDKAVESIRSQMEIIGRNAHLFDAVTIIRGGGGEVGLNCYDNYMLAREVALCPLPVLTGIGHSTNETVVEMIAGYNKITPTDVAYFIIQQFHNFSGRLNELHESLATMAKDLLEEEKKKWEQLCMDLVSQTDNLVRNEKRAIVEISGSVIDGTGIMITGQKHLLNLAGLKLSIKPGVLLRESRIGLDNRSERFCLHVKQLLRLKTGELENLNQKIDLLNPVQVLKRGYSITYLNGKALIDSAVAKPGDILTTRLFKGDISSEVKSIKD